MNPNQSREASGLNSPDSTWPDRYYWITGVIEGLVIAIFIINIPGDPKNEWLLGFSRSRLLLLGLIGLCVLAQLMLFMAASRGRLFLLPLLNRFLDEKLLYIALFTALSALILLAPSTYIWFDLARYQELIIRLLPIFAFVVLRVFQLILVAAVVLVQRSKRSARAAILSLLLFVGFLVLILANIWTYYLKAQVWDDFYFAAVQRYFLLFNVDMEHNVPTYFSALNLALASVILFIITRYKKENHGQYVKLWGLLGLVFVYLALDEVFLLHEKLAVPMDLLFNPEGVLGFFPWIIGFAPILIILALLYARFVFSLPKKTRNLFIISAVVFLSGAILFELAGGVYTMVFGVNKDARFVLYTIEETLEMNGIILFIFTLLGYHMANITMDSANEPL